MFHVFVAWLAMRRHIAGAPSPMGASAHWVFGQLAEEILQADQKFVGRQDAAECSGLVLIGSGHEQCEYCIKRKL